MKKLIFISVLAISNSLFAEVLSGVAKNQKGEIAYLEKHEITFDEQGFNKLIRVEYTKPDGQLIATMISDFSKNKNIPETVFEDKRFNTKVLLRISNSSVEIEEFKGSKSLDKTSFALDESMVAGQGFDNFIRSNLVKLSDKPVEFKFGVLQKKDFFSLTGYKKTNSSIKNVEYGIKVSNWLLRIFANELKVVYDAKTMRLKSFSGRSNILDDSGRAQDVIIDYQWLDNS